MIFPITAIAAIAALPTAFAAVPYHGGPVVSNIEITTIFYGTGARFQSQINQFYTAIVNSPYVDWLSEYNTPTQKIGRGRLLTSFTETSNIQTHMVDNTDVHNYFVNLVKTGKISPNANSYYALHLQQSTKVDYVWYTNGVPNTCSTCSGCGAWHTFIKLADYGVNIPGVPYLYYGILPDCGGSSYDAIAISHELHETITDPAGDEAALAAWCDLNDTSGGEITDKCEFGPSSGSVVGADGKTYTVANSWSNVLNKCIATNPNIKTTTTTTTTKAATSTTKAVTSNATTTTKAVTSSATKTTTTTTTTTKASGTTKTTTKAPQTTGSTTGACSTFGATQCVNHVQYQCAYYNGNTLTWGAWGSC
ncbi:hypothetical protein BDR26DRAFT_1006376 [Obelidium mucronatum]|nr:hypothetical protein BDR26DRAFT_1006376 [Obelidium mucronatum]